MTTPLVTVVIDDSTDKVIVGTHTYDSANGGSFVGSSGNAFPTSPTAGEWFWRTDTLVLHRRNDGNTAWEDVAAVATSHALTHENGGVDELNHSNLAGLATGDPHTQYIAHVDVSESEGFLRKVGGGTYEAIKTNLTATSSPTVADDSTAGYTIGSRWVDTAADIEFVCLDATAAAAVWMCTTTPTFRASEAVGGQTLATFPSTTTLGFDTVDIDVGGIGAYADPVLTIANTGRYTLGYGVVVDKTSGDRQNSAVVVFVNGVLATGTLAYGYHRTTLNGVALLTCTTPLNLLTGDTLTVRAAVVAGAGILVAQGGGNSFFWLVRLA